MPVHRSEARSRIDLEPYDHVILDSPPVLAVADPAIVASRVDGVILVARTGVIGRSELSQAAEKLRKAHGNLLGLAMNAVDLGNRYYGHRYSGGEQYAESDRESPAPPTGRQRASGA